MTTGINSIVFLERKIKKSILMNDTILVFFEETKFALKLNSSRTGARTIADKEKTKKL